MAEVGTRQRWGAYLVRQPSEEALASAFLDAQVTYALVAPRAYVVGQFESKQVGSVNSKRFPHGSLA
jgi:hypothetical protein